MSKAFAIYPIDKSNSTSFLNRIHTFETRMSCGAWHCYKVHFTDTDHERSIEQSANSHFIIFMGHGGSTKLHGACARFGEIAINPTASAENVDFYDKGTFIDSSNIAAFRGKIFFCFSCNSNEKGTRGLARQAIINGVEAFVGFGDIPTDYEADIQFSKRCIAMYKGRIVKIIKYAIFYAVEKGETVDNLVRIIKLLTTKEIQSLHLQRPFHGRDKVIYQLYKFKDGIKIFGDAYAVID